MSAHHIWDRIIKGLCAAGGAVAGLMGEWDVTLTILVALMGADYLSGVIVAACGRSPKSDGGGVSSKAGFIGLAKKGVMLLIVLLAALLDTATGSGNTMFRTATVMYYIANEGISIIENAALLGVPFPERIRGALEALKNERKPQDNSEQDNHTDE